MALKSINGILVAAIKTVSGIVAASVKTWGGETWTHAFPVDAADFDGTNDYMAWGAGLTGASDSSTGIFSGWCRIDGSDSTIRRLLSDLDGYVYIIRNASNIFYVNLLNAGATSTFAFKTVGTYTAGATWLNVLASWDTNASAGNKISHLYINDVSDKTVDSDASAAFNIDYTLPDWGIGASSGGSQRFDGAFSEFYFAPGQFLDFSVEANRRKFISATGKPVSLGADGSTPTGVAPIVYQRVADGAAVATFATNLGTGGNFSITGTLVTADTSPSD